MLLFYEWRQQVAWVVAVAHKFFRSKFLLKPGSQWSPHYSLVHAPFHRMYFVLCLTCTVLITSVAIWLICLLLSQGVRVRERDFHTIVAVGKLLYLFGGRSKSPIEVLNSEIVYSSEVWVTNIWQILQLFVTVFPQMIAVIVMNCLCYYHSIPVVRYLEGQK